MVLVSFLSLVCLNHLSIVEKAHAEWNFETVDALGPDSIHSSLGFDNAGNPHISYYDNINQDLKYAYYDGSSWHIETVDSEGYIGFYSSLALDLFGNPHISYWDLSNQDLKYAYYDGNSWHIETVDSEGYIGFYSSLALDSFGNPHISYYERDLKYAHYDGNSWQIETVDSSDDIEQLSSPSLALDINDNPHIIYFGTHELKYAVYDENQWEIQTVDDISYDVYYTGYASLVLDASGNPHISYCDLINYGFDDYESDLKYAYYDGNSWFIETVDSNGLLGLDSSMKLDIYGNPHISYCDHFPNYDLKYAYHDGISWYIETIASGTALSPSMALDPYGNPHISYFDLSNGSLIYVFWTEKYIDNILSFIDTCVADETLTGNGSGKSDEHRLDVFIKKIEAAGKHLDNENIKSAYSKLKTAYEWIDGESKPRDFVTGEAAPILATMIFDLMKSLENR